MSQDRSMNLNKIQSILLGLSIVAYTLRGNLGATFITLFLVVNIISSLSLLSVYKDKMLELSALFFLIFSVIMYAFRTLNFEYHLWIGYLAVPVILVESRRKYMVLWKILKIVSLFEALGIFVQRIIPSIYYALVSIILPNRVLLEISNRLSLGYYTGFSREVSYSMFLIIIGLGLYIYDFSKINNRRQRYVPIVFLFGALFISGKRATLIFFVVSLFLVQFLVSKNQFKILKYVGCAVVGIFLLVSTYQIWSRIPSLQRIVEMISYINEGDIIGLTNGRTVIYEKAIELWNENKVWGIGWGNFKYLMPSNSWYANYDVHNCFLQILTETGAVGAAFYYLFVLGCIVRITKLMGRAKKSSLDVRRIASFLVYVQLFFLFYSITEPVLYHYTCYIIFFLGVRETTIMYRKLQ